MILHRKYFLKILILIAKQHPKSFERNNRPVQFLKHEWKLIRENLVRIQVEYNRRRTFFFYKNTSIIMNRMFKI